MIILQNKTRHFYFLTALMNKAGLVRNVLDALFPDTGPRPGSFSSANKPNFRASRVGEFFRVFGRGAIGLSLAVDAARVVVSSDRARTLFQVSFGTLGAIGGGLVGAFGGSFVIPVAGTIAGGISGSALGSAGGEALGARIFDSFFRRREDEL